MILLNPFMFGTSLPAGVIAWYKGENNADDESGNYDATPGASTAYATGYDGVGTGFEFNGNVNSRVLTPTINLGTSYTVECWVYMTSPSSSGNNYSVIGNDFTSGSAFGTLYILHGGRLRYYTSSAVRVETLDNAVPLNKWFKVTLTYDGSKSRIYLNNILVATESGTHSETFNNTVGFAAPASATAQLYMTGKLDEVILRNTVTPPEVTGNLIAHYEAENNALDTVGYWHGTAGAGTAYDTGNTGNAFKFNGAANSAVTLSPIPLGSSYSIDFYLYTNASGNTGYRDFLGYSWTATSDRLGMLYLNAGKLEYWHGSSKRLQGVATIATTTWTRVKLTYNGSDSKSRLYINGVLDVTESGTHTENITLSAASIVLGYAGTSATNAINGRLDDIKLYNAVV